MSEVSHIAGLAPLDPRIKMALERFRSAERDLDGVVRALQRTCPHMQVLHVEYQSPAYGEGLKSLRMCACCRIEEDGSLGSSLRAWGRRGGGKSTLGNAPHRLVVLVSHEDIRRLRLPGGRYLNNPEKP